MDETNKFLELYKSTVQEEHWYIKDFQKQAKYFTTILLAVLSAIIGAMLKLDVNNIMHLFLLLIGCMFYFSTAFIAGPAISRAYNRFLRQIVLRIKIEEQLNLNKVPRQNSENNSQNIWPHESYIYPKHNNDRENFTDSVKFVEESEKNNKGYNKYIQMFFKSNMVLAFLLAFFCILQFSNFKSLICSWFCH